MLPFTTSWNPGQYLKFAQPRFRPAQDLLARIAIDNPQYIYDLGCGPGNVTQMLFERWPESKLVGIDDSAEMLAQAQKTQNSISWQQQSIATWQPDPPADVIFTNAALHWLPRHEELFPRLMRHLAPNGVLAVQMPRNFDEPSHALIKETIHAGPWQAKLAHLIQPSPVGSPSFYYGLVSPLASSVDIWEVEYLQVLHGQDPVKEWTKGTWLKQFLDVLDTAERPAFEADYAQRVRKAYPPQDGGETLFPFRRIFIVAQKKR